MNSDDIMTRLRTSLRGAGRIPAVAAFVAVLAVPGSAQTADPSAVDLTIEAALARTDATTSSRAARLRADGAALQAAAARGSRLPTVGALLEGMTTDDPVGAFGTRLRQGRFSQTDFAIDALNDPDRIADLSAGVEARWSLWSARTDGQVRAAQAGAEAAGAMADRTVEGARLTTRMLYLGLLQAESAVEAARLGFEAAEETLGVVELRAGQGQATEADRLRATAELAGRRAGLARAEALRVGAGEMLAAHLGLEPGTTVRATTTMNEVLDGLEAAVAARPNGAALSVRADVRAARAASRARTAESESFSGIALPAIEAYSGAMVHHGSGETGSSWTAGLRVTVPLLTGWSAGRQAEAVRSEARALELEAGQRLRDAAAEVATIEAELDAALLAVDATDAALAASVEAERLTRLRYAEGMATLSDLLSAQAGARGARTEADIARARLGSTLARWLFAVGDSDDDSADPAILNDDNGADRGPEFDR